MVIGNNNNNNNNKRVRTSTKNVQYLKFFKIMADVQLKRKYDYFGQ
jgi:hypothetical protein